MLYSRSVLPSGPRGILGTTKTYEYVLKGMTSIDSYSKILGCITRHNCILSYYILYMLGGI